MNLSQRFRSPSRRFERLGAILISGFLASACATSPTGRKQMMLMSDSKMDDMGTQAFEELKKKTPIETNPAWNAYVRCIALPIAEAARSKLPAGQWEVVVFKDDTANAFALPGGKIGVHTGILKVAKTDAQLAAVLGHEVGHVIARHGNERVSEGLVAQGVLVTTSLVTKDSPKQGMIMGLMGVGAQFGYLLPHSRTQESEADLIGLDLMSKAGFDPRQSVDLWKNMASAGGKGPPEFLSTHPANDTRIGNLSAHIPENLPKYEASQKRSCPRPQS